MQLYAGRLDISRYPDLARTPIGIKNLYLFNFDSLLAAFVTLFHSFFGPMYTVIHESALAVSEVNSYITNLYFFSFNIIATLLGVYLYLQKSHPFLSYFVY